MTRSGLPSRMMPSGTEPTPPNWPIRTSNSAFEKIRRLPRASNRCPGNRPARLAGLLGTTRSTATEPASGSGGTSRTLKPKKAIDVSCISPTATATDWATPLRTNSMLGLLPA